MMNPLQYLYSLLLHVDQRKRLRRRYRPEHPVISVGGITTGGAGKTPLVLMISEFLEDAGLHPVVLSRGYRSHLETGYGCVCSGKTENPDPDLYGDEPVFLVDQLRRTCVVVGRRRTENLQRFLRERGPDGRGLVLILDDGFQHLQIERDLDIVLIDRMGATGGKLLPTGDLREPLRHLERADLVFLVDPVRDVSAPPPGIPTELSMLDIRIETASERTLSPRSDVDGSQLPDGSRRVVLVTGIARPGRVLSALLSQDVDVRRHIRYGDHHRYTARDARSILQAMESEEADAIVTTGKDVVKLRRFENLRPMLFVVPHRIEPDDPEGLGRFILERISQFTDSVQ